jgi:hypothetical protein
MYDHIRKHQEQINKGIASTIGGDALNQEELEKSADDFFEKGGKKAAIGEIKEFGGRSYIKTVDGWKYHGKGTGAKAQQHSQSIPAAKEQDAEWNHGLKEGDTVKHQDKEKKVSVVMGNNLKFTDGTEAHVDKVYDKDGKSYAKNVGESPKPVEKQEAPKEKPAHGLEGYDTVKHHKWAGQLAEHMDKHEKEMKEKTDGKWWSHEDKNKPLIDSWKKEFEASNPLGYKNDLVEKIGGLKNIAISGPSVDKNWSNSQQKNTYKLPSYKDAKAINMQVKKAADLLVTNKPLHKVLKKLDDFCAETGSQVRIDLEKIETSPDGKFATVPLNVSEKWDKWKDDQPSTILTATVTPDGVHFLGLEEKLRHHAASLNSNADMKSIKQFKYALAAANKVSGTKINATFDEEFAKLKSQYEASTGSIMKYLRKVDDKTLHYDLGHIGKKNMVHDTIMSAAKQTPPAYIGPYKLVSPDKVLSYGPGGGMVDKQKVLKDMLKHSENKYSEYENNQTFTYVYKKA